MPGAVQIASRNTCRLGKRLKSISAPKWGAVQVVRLTDITSRGLTIVEDKCSPWTLPTRSAAGSSKCGTSMSKQDNATPRLDMRISTARISICRTWRREICVSGVHDAEPRRRSPQTHNELLQPVQRDLFGSTRLERQRRYARRRPSHSYANKLDDLGC